MMAMSQWSYEEMDRLQRRVQTLEAQVRGEFKDQDTEIRDLKRLNVNQMDTIRALQEFKANLTSILGLPRRAGRQSVLEAVRDLKNPVSKYVHHVGRTPGGSAWDPCVGFDIYAVPTREETGE
jgi:hypothetical protein